MNRYQRGKIYSIRSDSTDEIYIGSTIQPLSERLREHRNKYKLHKEGKYHYVSSFKLLEHDNHYIELVELYPCNSKEELQRREGEIMRTTNNIVNRVIAGRTRREHYEDNKERILQYQQQYKKQFYEVNKEDIQQYKKQYYEVNKEAILQQQKQKITCECGTIHTINTKARHLRTIKHQRYEESNHLFLNILFEE